MNFFKFSLLILLGVLCSVAAAAQDVFLVDRTSDAASLRDFLGRAFAGKSGHIAFPKDLSISIISSEQLDGKTTAGSIVLWVEEEFAPVVADEKTQFTVMPFALLPVVAAVSVDCPIDNLSLEDLKMIYSGRISDWGQLGVEPNPIRIAGASVNSAEGRIFRKLVMQQDIFSSKSPAPGNDILPDMLVCSTPDAAERLLKAFPGMIVFGSWKLASANKGDYKILKINGTVPSVENIVARRYPIAARHQIRFKPGKSREKISNIVDFLEKSALAGGKSLKIQ